MVDVSVTVVCVELNVSEPLAVIEGAVGAVKSVTTLLFDCAEQLGPLYALTQYVPAAATAMLRVVAPVDQRYPLAVVDVKVSVAPGQTFNELFDVTVGTVGPEFAFTAVTVDVPPQPPALVVTV